MKKENPLLNLAINIVIPFLILTKFSKEEYLGPVYGLMVALAFPLIYGLYEFIFLKQKNITSIIGFIGILLSGVIGLMQFPPHWIAVKEAMIPLAIGVVVLFSTNKTWQITTKFLYNRELLDIDKIEEKLAENNCQPQMKQILNKANLFLSFSFFFSAILNYVLAKIVVTSNPGTPQFNEELGNMTMLSFPVIAVPSMLIMFLIFRYLLTSMKKLTQLTTKEILSEKFRE